MRADSPEGIETLATRRKINPFPDAQKWETHGDKVEGVYLGSRTVRTVNGDSDIHRFNNNGSIVDAWGTTALNGAMEQVTEGEYVEIEYVSDDDTGKGNPTKMFDVFVIDD